MGWEKIMVRFQTFEQIHNKKNIGSTRIRVHNLLKYWPEAGVYQYGEKPDVLIFQKAYVTQDNKFPALYNGGKKILDICDPDWLDGALIRQTIDGVDAVTCSSQDLVDFLSQMTDKPVRLIRDRFDISEFPKPKVHSGTLKRVGWFGYSHNAETLKFAIPSLLSRHLVLRVIADSDPEAWRWAGDDTYKDKYEYHKHRPDSLYKLLQECDVIVFPKGTRPVDRFKSENKTTIARLLGLPVVETAEELDTLVKPEARNDYVKKWYEKTKKDFDVKLSVKEYKKLIDELK